MMREQRYIRVLGKFGLFHLPNWTKNPPNLKQLVYLRKHREQPPPQHLDQIIFILLQFLGKNYPNNRWSPPEFDDPRLQSD